MSSVSACNGSFTGDDNTAGHDNYSTSSLLESSSANASSDAEESDMLGTTVNNLVFGAGTWTDTGNPSSMIRVGLPSNDALDLAGVNSDLPQDDTRSYDTTPHSATWVETFTLMGFNSFMSTYDSTTHDDDATKNLYNSVVQANSYHSTTHDKTGAREHGLEDEKIAFGMSIYDKIHHYDMTFTQNIHHTHIMDPFKAQPIDCTLAGTSHPPLTTPLRGFEDTTRTANINSTNGRTKPQTEKCPLRNGCRRIARLVR